MKSIDKSKIVELVQLYQTGRLPEVEKKAKELVLVYPKEISLYNLLGVTLARQNKFDEACEYFKKGIKTSPNFYETYNNLGNLLFKQKRYKESLKYLEKAIQINKNFAEAYFNIANVLQKTNNLDKAILNYKKAIKLNPNYFNAYLNLGNILLDRSNLKEANEIYNSALKINPRNAELYYNLGNLCLKNNELTKASNYFERAISINNNHFESYFNLGIVLSKMGNNKKAIESYRIAIKINSNFFEAYNNLGKLFHNERDYNEALKNYDKAIAIKTDNPEVLNNIANILQKQNRIDEAIKKYKKAIEFNNGYTEAYTNLGMAFDAKLEIHESKKCYEKAYKLNKNSGTALIRLYHQKQICCDWDQNKKLKTDLIKYINNLDSKKNEAVEPFPMLSITDDPEVHLKTAQHYAKTIQSKVHHSLIINKHNEKNNYDVQKIKIAYISADYQNHPVYNSMIELFELHDRNNFEVHAISYGEKSKDSSLNSRLFKSFDYFHDVKNFSDKEIVELILSLKIFIAIDLMGYTKKYRPNIFVMKPAPLQISYLGYLGTLGGKYIDYIIADKNVIPEKNKKFYTEKVIYMPSCYQVNCKIPKISNENISKEKYGLPEKSIIFGCFNSNYKITKEIFHVWMEILKEVNKSVLWLYESNKWSSKNLIKEAKKYKISSDRIVFAKKLTIKEHLKRITLMDLFLDTFPYNAGATCSQVLSMGVPVLTLMGDSFTSRLASSQLKSIGMPELIAENFKDYKSLAIDLANNKQKVLDMKVKLRSKINESSLFNSKVFTSNLEIFYKKLASEYIKQQDQHIH